VESVDVLEEAIKLLEEKLLEVKRESKLPPTY
jgi:hypothetical protein